MSKQTTLERGTVVWLTGLSGSGKTTTANQVAAQLNDLGLKTVVLDGDQLRLGLCADLGFSIADRNENVRRVGELAKLFLALGFVVLVALVSPIRSAREKVKLSFAEKDFIEVYCCCPFAVCQARDPKGLYAHAISGEIAEFTGVSSPYEAPLKPNLMINTDTESFTVAAQRLTQYIVDHLRY
jgi:adenylylsulfate kinase